MKNFEFKLKKKKDREKPKWSLKKQGVWQKQMRKKRRREVGARQYLGFENGRGIVELRWVWIRSLTKFLRLESLGGNLWVAHT